MNVVKLEVDGSIPGGLTFEMARHGQQSLKFEYQTDFTFEDLTDDPTKLLLLLPLPLANELRQWILDDPSPGLLAIVSPHARLDGIPWEYLPQVFEMPTVFVVRLVERPDQHPNGILQDQPRLLAAGWSGKPFLDLPGIQKELNALSKLGVEEGVNVRVLSEPDRMGFAEAYDAVQPQILHLVPPGLRYENQMPEIVISGSDDIQWVGVDNLLSQAPTKLPRLVVLNVCFSGDSDSGPSATRIVTERLGSMTVGWYGEVQDMVAVDFSRFFYTRLLEGETVIDALRSYNSLQPLKRNPERAARGLIMRPRPRFKPIPVVWTASLDLLTESLLAPRPVKSERELLDTQREGRPATRRGSQPPSQETPSDTADSTDLPTVEMEFEPQMWLNPALLKNGRPVIVKLSFNPNRSLENVSLAITCDTGSGSSTVRQTTNLKQGYQPYNPVSEFQFPILYQLIQDDVSRRQINFTITCHLRAVLLAEMTKSALWMDRAEWLDKPDTWHFIPAFVQPNADGVLDVIDKAYPILQTLVTPGSMFSGYQTSDSDYIWWQVEALFNCLRDTFSLNYITPPPLPVYAPGESVSSGQQVRSPDLVIDRKRGTCHDLSILLASCLEHIGIFPLIFLIRGHTFVGYWNDVQAHRRFWRNVENDITRQSPGPGRNWTIVNVEEIQQLLQDGLLSCVEATKVTKHNETFSAAIEQGGENLYSEQQPFDIAIDIQRSRREIQPL